MDIRICGSSFTFMYIYIYTYKVVLFLLFMFCFGKHLGNTETINEYFEMGRITFLLGDSPIPYSKKYRNMRGKNPMLVISVAVVLKKGMRGLDYHLPIGSMGLVYLPTFRQFVW